MHAPAHVWEEATSHFDSREPANLMWTITVINGWNRIAISSRMPPEGT